MFNPVSYLMGAAADDGGGGGGGSWDPLLLNHEYDQSTGSGRYEYDQRVSIPENGKYLIIAYGFATSLKVYINDVEQANNFNNTTNYTYLYNNEKMLNKNDTVRIDIQSTGLTALSASVIRIE